MNSFGKIKGYNNVKAELMQISDILRNPEEYDRLGVSLPRGLLLIGDPGVGKTLMSKCLIEDSGWNSFICRKDRPDGAFINHIRETFNKAKSDSPSIILLDDLDKFANEDEEHNAAEEYVTVQACIDDARDSKVFVIATVNDEWKLPESLIRSGRFDKRIYIENPKGKEAVEIVGAFLKDKKFVSNVDPSIVAQLLEGSSCAELETIINNAGLRAGYDRRETIDMQDIINAYLNLPYCKDYVEELSLKRYKLTAVHEAGHAVASELLFPGSVTLVSIIPSGSNSGLTCRHHFDSSILDINEIKSEIEVYLAGKAAIEIVYGVAEIGCSRDIRNAFEYADMIANTGGIGLNSCQITRYNDTSFQEHEIEKAKIKEVEEAYKRIKEKLAQNRSFLDSLVQELLDKKVVMSSDLAALREGSTN